MNKIAIIGRLTKDLETTSGLNGLSYVHFTIAHNDYMGNKVFTYYFNCTAFGKVAENMKKYLHKGSRVAIVGKLAQRKFIHKETGKEYTTNEIICESIDFLETKVESAETTEPAQEQPQEQNQIEDAFEDLPF